MLSAGRLAYGIAPLGVLILVLLLGATCATLWGGMQSFIQMMARGILGSFAAAVLHGGEFTAGSAVVAVFVWGGMLLNLRYRTGWTLACGLMGAAIWPLIGWGIAV